MISFPGRIPVHIFPFFWMLILMIGWLNSASLPSSVLSPVAGMIIWAVVIFISVLVHEYGHALTAVFFGQRAEISLVGLGGVTKREGPQLAKWKDFVIVMNGPLAGILLFLISYSIWGRVDDHRVALNYALQVAVQVNLFWTLVNLLPVLPLDGGQLLRILLEGAFGLLGLKIAFLISIVLAGAIGLYFFVSQQLLMGALFLMLGFESYRAWDEVKGMSSSDDSEALRLLIKEGIEDLQVGRQQEAFVKFSFVRQEVSRGKLYMTATQHGARILAEQGNFKQAYLWLYPLKSQLPADYLLLLQQLAYRLEEWEEAIQAGELACRQHPSPESALLNALAYAIIGQAAPAAGWLRSAIQLGLPDAKGVIVKKEFDAIRNSDPFQKLIKSLA